MSKTVSGYIMIENVTFREIIQNPIPAIETFYLAQETGILPAYLKVYQGTVTMYDGQQVTGIILRGRSSTETFAITETGIVYDDWLSPALKNSIIQVIQQILPANYELERRKAKLKGLIKSARKSLAGTKLMLEVELA